MEAKPQFHGSDTAAVAAFYHVPVDEIVCFGANVNPLGLSKNLKKDLAAHLDLLSSYPDRNYTTLKKVIATQRFAPVAFTNSLLYSFALPVGNVSRITGSPSHCAFAFPCVSAVST